MEDASLRSGQLPAPPRRAPLIMVSVGFGLWLGLLTALSIFDEAAGWAAW